MTDTATNVEQIGNRQLQLLATIREIYGRVVWSHKTHEKQREICSDRARRDNWINVMLTASTTIIAVISIVLIQPWAGAVTIFSAGITTLFAVYRLSFSPEREAQTHRQAAKALLIERDHLLLLIERCMAASSDELDEIRRELKRATDKVGLIYSNAPDTSPLAYGLASKALHLNEELTFSAHEIDLLLPPDLRITKDNQKEQFSVAPKHSSTMIEETFSRSLHCFLKILFGILFLAKSEGEIPSSLPCKGCHSNRLFTKLVYVL